METIRILLQTTIPAAADDWHIGRFSLLERHLGALQRGDLRAEVVGRNLERAPGGSDPVLANLAESSFDELWLFAVDVGDGLDAAECEGIQAFRRRGGGVLTSRDHQDLGCSLLSLGSIGAGNFFHTRNLDPSPDNQAIDDTETNSISWPNYHSGKNGDVQPVRAPQPVHDLLKSPSGVVAHFPAHPHEGAVGAPASDPSARVIAVGRSKLTGREFNLVVAFEGARDDAGQLGRAIVDSSFHHFADYNWDIQKGAPSFVSEPPGQAIADDPSLLDDIKVYVHNLAIWLANRVPSPTGTA